MSFVLINMLEIRRGKRTRASLKAGHDMLMKTVRAPERTMPRLTRRYSCMRFDQLQNGRCLDQKIPAFQYNPPLSRWTSTLRWLFDKAFHFEIAARVSLRFHYSHSRCGDSQAQIQCSLR